MNDGKVYVVNVLVGKILRVQRVGVQCTKDLFFDIFERRERDHCALNKVEKMCSAHFVDNNDLIFELVMKKQIFLSRLLAQKKYHVVDLFQSFRKLRK